MPRLLKALGIDAHDLDSALPVLLRDMERVCTVRQHNRRCERDLVGGTSPEHFADYCPNAPTLSRLDTTALR